MNLSNPFDPSVFDKLDDLCRNEHKGHEESVSAQSCLVDRTIDLAMLRIKVNGAPPSSPVPALTGVGFGLLTRWSTLLPAAKRRSRSSAKWMQEIRLLEPR